MALIAKGLKIEWETLPFRLPKELAAKAGLHARTTAFSRDYVVTQILQVIARDRGLAVWLEQRGVDQAHALASTDSVDRPPGSSGGRFQAGTLIGLGKNPPWAAVPTTAVFGSAADPGRDLGRVSPRAWSMMAGTRLMGVPTAEPPVERPIFNGDLAGPILVSPMVVSGSSACRRPSPYRQGYRTDRCHCRRSRTGSGRRRCY